jgi:hypothetical protein
LPGRIQKDKEHYFYAADTYFVFAGVKDGETVKTATYYYAERLGYYGRLGQATSIFPGGPYDTRPAYYDLNQSAWVYLNSAGDGYVTTLNDPDEEELRRKKSTNWLVSDWRDLVLSGTKAKIWSGVGDPRGITEYSDYKQMQKLLANTVGYEGEGF